MTKPIFANENESFATGAKRGSQAGKCRPDLTSPFAAERKGWVSAHGAEHYGDRNWEKGMPFSRVIASACRHLMQYTQGDRSEDHLAQLGWNIDALLHFEEMIKLGLLPASLDDLPHYRQRAEGEGKPLEVIADFEYDEARKIAADEPPSAGLPLGMDGTAGTIARNASALQLDLLALLHLDAPAKVAEQIAAGITYADRDPADSRHVVYLAGPMRGYEAFNFAAFDRFRDRFVAGKYDVISPADIDRQAGDENEGDQALFCLRDFFSIYFICMLRRAGIHGCIALMPGWEASVGASAEFLIARWLGVPVLDAATMKPLNHQDVKTIDFLDSIRRFLAGQLVK